LEEEDMAFKQLALDSIMMAAASPLAARQPQPMRESVAPEAPADARYCLRVDPPTPCKPFSQRPCLVLYGYWQGI
jgi:hypothetical protein